MDIYDKMHSGELYDPADGDLTSIQMPCADLCWDYNQLRPSDYEGQQALLKRMLGDVGEGCYITPPFYANWGGKHLHLGDHVYSNFGLTIVDDTHIYVGDHTEFGPNVTIVTPMHPLIAEERNCMLDAEGNPSRFCYALPVNIGNNIWFGANVTVCGGVTIGDNCVIGAGSVVTKDIPAGSLAAGVPCRVIRPITEADSMVHKPEILGDNKVIGK